MGKITLNDLHGDHKKIENLEHLFDEDLIYVDYQSEYCDNDDDDDDNDNDVDKNDEEKTDVDISSSFIIKKKQKDRLISTPFSTLVEVADGDKKVLMKKNVFVNVSSSSENNDDIKNTKTITRKRNRLSFVSEKILKLFDDFKKNIQLKENGERL
jgi:hypothetical protein